MYSKQEASQLKEEFWTSFGRYMSPVLSAEGVPVNWINYKTGIPNVSFKMDADSKKATIGITFSHNDTGIQELYYEQLLQLKNMLHAAVGEDWDWNKLQQNEYYKIVSGASITLSGVNIYNKETWPTLISFFKQRIIALDEFWSMARYGFEELI